MPQTTRKMTPDEKRRNKRGNVARIDVHLPEEIDGPLTRAAAAHNMSKSAYAVDAIIEALTLDGFLEIRKDDRVGTPER